MIAGIIWIAGMVLAAVVDVYLATDRITGNTWSELTRSWAEKSIIIPWIAGVIAGHWFHWFKEGNAFNPTSMWVLIGLTIPVLVGGILVHNLVHPFPNWLLMVVLQLGILAGALLWRV